MPRTNYRVSITPPGREAVQPPYRDYYPVVLCNGALLNLPIEPLPGGREAIALLMSNQTDFAVEKELGASLSKVAAEFSSEAIVGIPTLGLDYARIVARIWDLRITSPWGTPGSFGIPTSIPWEFTPSPVPERTKSCIWIRCWSSASPESGR